MDLKRLRFWAPWVAAILFVPSGISALFSNTFPPVLLFGVGFGMFFFLFGFSRLRRRRLIENIPTSTVRGLALGLVELAGVAKNKTLLKAPFTGTDCVFFRYTIERWEKRGKSSEWVDIAEGDSSSSPFFLDDTTGSVMILPKGAELFQPVDFEFKNGWGNPLPENLIYFLQRQGVPHKTLFGFSSQLRFREWRISEGQQVYVLGSAKESSNYQKQHQDLLIRRLEELKTSPAKMAEVDTNKDGAIDHMEWDVVVARVEQEVIEEELKSSAAISGPELMVAEGEEEKIFIISNYSQKDLNKRLFWESFGLILGGIAIV
ncbi:MAG: hypothetical protein COV71_02795, partial [Candidatus Omnitrophica bacterium CG11_big_fil_rev_8_21_14_0_20_41_12]